MDSNGRNRVREAVIADVWSQQYSVVALSFLWSRITDWFRSNAISFGLLISWQKGGVGARTTIGRRIALLTIESATRVFVIGWTSFDQRDLRDLARARPRLRLRVVGWLRIAGDVDPCTAGAALGSVRVIGRSRMPRRVRLRLKENAA